MGNVYTVHKDGSQITTFDDFRLNKEHRKLKVWLDDILGTIAQMGMTDGYYRSLLRYEAGDSIFAFPSPDGQGELRLYAIIYEPDCIVLYTGGRKTSRSWQEDTTLRPIVEELMSIESRIEGAIHAGRFVLDRRLKGFINPHQKRKVLLQEISFR